MSVPGPYGPYGTYGPYDPSPWPTAPAPRCAWCPLGPGPACPAADWPAYCRWAELERSLPEPRRYWTRKLRAEAAARPDPGPVVPDFPSRAPRRPGTVRVGLLCPVLTQGGAERWQLTLARAADPGRVDWRGCAVLTGEADPAMVAELRPFMPVAVGGGLAAARALAAGCDVLVAWFVADLAAILAGLMPPPRVIGVAHSPAQSGHAVGFYARPEPIDHWVAVSEPARAALPESARAGARIIATAVDPGRLRGDRSRERMHAAWGIPPGAAVAGYYGRLSPEKDPAAMIDLARALPEPWHVAVVGPDYGGGDLQARSRDLPRLRWLGPDPAAGDVLRAMDVLVCPSRFESWGLTIAEALWVGTPVVSTPVGLAALHPGITRLIPHDAPGAVIAAEVRASVIGRPPGQLEAIRALLPALDPARFGREWTEFLEEIGRSSSEAVTWTTTGRRS